MVRHVDALDPLPDEKIKELDAAYLVRRHSTSASSTRPQPPHPQ